MAVYQINARPGDNHIPLTLHVISRVQIGPRPEQKYTFDHGILQKTYGN